jgi:hypothetical protein
MPCSCLPCSALALKAARLCCLGLGRWPLHQLRLACVALRWGKSCISNDMLHLLIHSAVAARRCGGQPQELVPILLMVRHSKGSIVMVRPACAQLRTVEEFQYCIFPCTYDIRLAHHTAGGLTCWST